MLRTLGYKKQQLISLLGMQTLVFSVPATIVGVLVMILLLYGVKIAVYNLMHFPLYTEIGIKTIIIVSARGGTLLTLCRLSFWVS